MLIPSEISGIPAEGGPRCRGESDLDFDVFRLPAAGERRLGCPMRNSSDGVSTSVDVFSRFIVKGSAPSSAALTGVDAPEPTDIAGDESLRLRRWRSCCPLMDSFLPPCRSPDTTGSSSPALRFPNASSVWMLIIGTGGCMVCGGGFAGRESG